MEKEVESLLSRLLLPGMTSGGIDLEASEMAIRRSMHQVGAFLLEKVLNAEPVERSTTPVLCDQSHGAVLEGYRDKELLTVLGSVHVRRAYFHCPTCSQGVLPKDQALNIAGTSFSPGVRRMMGRVGSQEPFQLGQRDLEELAGLPVTAKQVERVAEALGREVEKWGKRAELPVPLPPPDVKAQVPFLYIAYDGTGVPMVKLELEGHPGKEGKAKTREAKLGCVFTQTGFDKAGHPQRDEGSTSYVGAIETAEAFGERIYREALRRGLERAQRLIVLGDGAPWIWNLADEYFPGAIQIVDLYHACQHLSDLAKLAYGIGSANLKLWLDQWISQLKAGKVESVMGAIWALSSAFPAQQESIEKGLHYFQNNAERMRYADFREPGLFVGSGVTEAGCKTIVGQRLKQSGMH